MEKSKYNSIQLIDGDGNFNMADAKKLQRMSNIDAFKRSYGVISVMGPQSVGKSTLLNNLFDTNFVEMDALEGRNQTTRGVWTAVHSSSPIPIIVLDVEGSDGRERGEDTLFERQSALFNLAVSDVVLINIWNMEVGREYGAGKPLLRTIFQVMKRLFNKPQKTTLLFVVRDKERTPLSKLEEILTRDTRELWNQAHQDTPMDSFFNVEVKALSHYQSQKFKEEVADLKAHLIEIIRSKRVAGKGQDVEHASEFFRSTEETWKKIKGNKDLDIPTQRVMLAHTRCVEISDTICSSLNNNEDWCALQNSVQSGRATHFGSIINPLLRASIQNYMDKTDNFDKDIRELHGAKLKESLLQAVHPAWGSFLGHIKARILHEYEEALNKALQHGKTTFTVAASNCAQTCLDSFDAESSEFFVEFADWNASHVRDELQRSLDEHKASLSSSKLSTLTSNQEGYLIRNLHDGSLGHLLEEVGNNTWQEIRGLIENRIESCMSEVNGELVSYGLGENAAEVRTRLRSTARNVAELKVKEKLSKVPILMKQRFDKLFVPQSSFAWTESENIPGVTTLAYSSALELLSFCTAIRWEDDQQDRIRSTLFAALLESPTTSAYRLNSESWQDVPESRTLITPVSCKSYWKKFESETTGAIEDAKRERKMFIFLKRVIARAALGAAFGFALPSS